MGVVMQHYFLLFPAHAIEEVEYYSNWGFAGWHAEAEGRRWLAESYLTLRRACCVHNVCRYSSWPQRYRRPDPPRVSSPDQRGRVSLPSWRANRVA
jgi:hypothetical protein